MTGWKLSLMIPGASEADIARGRRNAWNGDFLIITAEGDPRCGNMRVSEVEKQSTRGHHRGYAIM
jgi:hypothetical protein